MTVQSDRICAGFPHERQTRAADTSGSSSVELTARLLLPSGISTSRIASVLARFFVERGGGTAVLGNE